MTGNVVVRYLKLLDAQREAVFAILDGLPEAWIWQRPAPKEWSIGKNPAALGNVHAYDPATGVVNLKTALKVGIDHHQLHYHDVIEIAVSPGYGTST